MKSYIISVIAAAIICAISRALLSEKTAYGQLVKLLTGILMTITVISPLIHLSFDRITDYFDGLTWEANAYVADGESFAQENTARIIKEKTEAYILDKANCMGLEIAVEVELDADNNSIPGGVVITGSLSPYAKEVMSGFMEDTLGIAKENQKWK